MPRTPLILAAAVACVCAACSQQSPQSSAPASAASAAKATTAATPAPASTAPDLGINLAYIDKSVKPGDNFFDYANGDWLKTAQIPADRSSTGSFLDVFEITEKHTSDLIRNAGARDPAAGSNARKIADYYAAYMDTAAIDKAGLTPLKPELDAIDAIKTRADLARVLGSRLRADVDPINATNFHTSNLFGLFVTKGLEEASTQIPYLLQGGLAMPSRDYYLSKDTHMAEARDKYKTYVVALLKQAGIADADKQADAVIALETKIAEAQESLVDSEDIHKANTLWSVAELPKKAPGLDWNAYFKAAGLDGVKQIDVWQPSAIAGEAKLVASQPIDAWKALLTFHTLNAAAPLLPKPYEELSFGFFGKTLQGTPAQRERWKRAVGATNSDLGDAVGQLYVKQYFPASSKAAAEAMVKNLIAAFRSGIQNLTWMSPETKQKAEAKLDTLKVGVGYPDRWRDYSSLEIKPDDALGNHLRAVKFEYELAKAKIGKPIDDHEWWMTPQTVNAVNLPLQNAMNFPAAILNPPFYDAQGDPIRNYGAVGTVIGHEISHSFDDQGAQFDASGRLANWWTPEDLAHFNAVGERLVAQYNAYEPLPGVHINGKLTLSENIADVAGVAAAYDGYRLAYAGKPLPDLDGFTADQRFFIGYGQAWRTKDRPEALRSQLMTDGHAPGEFRADAVRNVDAWYGAFDVLSSQKLYLSPEARVKVW